MDGKKPCAPQRTHNPLCKKIFPGHGKLFQLDAAPPLGYSSQRVGFSTFCILRQRKLSGFAQAALRGLGEDMFSPNNLVVYPAQGVGEIERIESRNIGDAECRFYIVRIRANNVTLMVPVSNADHVGLRPPVPAPRAQEILDSLHGDTEKTVHTGQNWNRRFREYSERLKDPELGVVAGVLRELLLIGRQKELSFGERRLREQAMSLVTGELAVVLQRDEDQLRSDLLERYAPPPAPEEAL